MKFHLFKFYIRDVYYCMTMRNFIKYMACNIDKKKKRKKEEDDILDRF